MLQVLSAFVAGLVVGIALCGVAAKKIPAYFDDMVAFLRK